VWKVIERRFKEETKFWLSKPGNFDKHVEFLTNRILGRFSDCYDDAELTEALVHSEALHLLDYFLWESWL